MAGLAPTGILAAKGPTSKPSMNHLFTIPELVAAIFSHLTSSQEHDPASRAGPDTATLTVLARTCHVFHDPAIDLIWKNIPGLSALLRCLPDDAWEVTDAATPYNCPVLKLTRSPLDSEWSRLEHYSTRVRHLCCDSELLAISRGTYTTLHDRYCSASCDALLPQLLSYRVGRDSGVEFRSLAPLLPSSLVELRAENIETAVIGRFAAALDDLSRRCPYLETLAIDTIPGMTSGHRSDPEDSDDDFPVPFDDDSSSDSDGSINSNDSDYSDDAGSSVSDADAHKGGATISSAFCNFKLLRTVDIDLALSGAAINHLASLTSLRSLKFCPKFEENVHFPSCEEAFPCLESLITLGSTRAELSAVVRLLKSITSPVLRTLRLAIRGRQDSGNMRVLVATISQRRFLPALKTVEIKFSYMGSTCSRMGDLAPLLPARGIRHANLGSVDLDDNDMRLIADSWPLLATLAADTRKPRVTLNGLLTLLKGCPRLRNLDYFSINSSGAVPNLDKDNDVPVNRDIKALHIGESAVDDPRGLALFLSRCLPNVKCIDQSGWNIEDDTSYQVAQRLANGQFALRVLEAISKSEKTEGVDTSIDILAAAVDSRLRFLL